ncbi:MULTISPECIES: hypothetical protein [Yersinia]|uniref:hypothetical protein n=1 Tax=Yersinia TaxID=629 RepID=UPI0011805136|nr:MULTISPECIES: hypothetical protein [Yersinia]MBS0053844.1 hypothetical protein [Yersinia sp. Marseille-Q3913]MCB5303872.1 hypothetical protein [Yersinia bercovieri]MDN0101365.1 hypothetical protein [Yersinia bercovieri]QKJ05889.1 hypothetical protein HRK25_02455 [Yersinia bercovieri ATCC 43970]
MKKKALIALSMTVRWLGLGLGSTGIGWGVWFFIFSDDNYRILWGLYCLLQAYIGFLAFRFGLNKIQNEFDNH